MKNFLLYCVAATVVCAQGLVISPSGSNLAAPGPIGGGTPDSGAFTTLSASSTVSGAGFTTRFANPGPIGNTTPSTGAFTTITATSNATISGGISAGAAQIISWSGGAIMSAQGTTGITIKDSSNADFGRLNFGGVTSSFPAIKRNGTAINFRLADDSADAPITSGTISVGANITISSTAMTLGAGVTLDASAATVLLPPFSVPFLIPGSAAPTLDAVGETAYDSDFFAASKGALEWFDGTGVRVIPAYTNAVAPADGEPLVWDNTNKWWEPGAKNAGLTVYAAGTAYAMTNSAAAMDFGTTDPTLVITAPGTYLIFGRGLLKYNGATYVGSETATIKLRRTNNTAADLTNATTTATLRIITTVTDTVGVMPLPPVLYTTILSDDSISVFGVLSAAPSAGSVDATEASIVAVRLF